MEFIAHRPDTVFFYHERRAILYGGLVALGVPVAIYINRFVSGRLFPNPADFDEKHAALIVSAGDIGTSAAIAVVSFVVCHFALKHYKMKKS